MKHAPTWLSEPLTILTMKLCELPTEVLNQILEYLVPGRRIAAQKPTDPEWIDYWDDEARQPKQLPSIFFVNKKLTPLSLAIFYDKAILEIQPVKPPQYIINGLERGLSLDLTSEPSMNHAFCPSDHLRRIKQVHIFTGQSDAINAEGYEATLRWLIEHTAVKHIHLSRRILTRLRKTRVAIDSALTAVDNNERTLVRTIYIWTKHARSFWEKTRVREMTKVGGIAPPLVQMYLYCEKSGMDPVLDPRWDVKSSDSEERQTASRPLTDLLDDLAAKDNPLSVSTIIMEGCFIDHGALIPGLFHCGISLRLQLCKRLQKADDMTLTLTFHHDFGVKCTCNQVALN